MTCQVRALFDDEDGLTVLNGLPVLPEYGFDLSRRVRFYLIEDFHGFDDAQDVSHLYSGAHFDESFGAR